MNPPTSIAGFTCLACGAIVKFDSPLAPGTHYVPACEACLDVPETVAAIKARQVPAPRNRPGQPGQAMSLDQIEKLLEEREGAAPSPPPKPAAVIPAETLERLRKLRAAHMPPPPPHAPPGEPHGPTSTDKTTDTGRDAGPRQGAGPSFGNQRLQRDPDRDGGSRVLHDTASEAHAPNAGAQLRRDAREVVEAEPRGMAGAHGPDVIPEALTDASPWDPADGFEPAGLFDENVELQLPLESPTPAPMFPAIQFPADIHAGRVPILTPYGEPIPVAELITEERSFGTVPKDVVTIRSSYGSLAVVERVYAYDALTGYASVKYEGDPARIETVSLKELEAIRPTADGKREFVDLDGALRIVAGEVIE